MSGKLTQQEKNYSEVLHVISFLIKSKYLDTKKTL